MEGIILLIMLLYIETFLLTFVEIICKFKPMRCIAFFISLSFSLLTFGQSPTANFSMSASQLCQGECITLTKLYLSGFFSTDINELRILAEAIGLKYNSTNTKDEWAMLILQK